MRKKIKNNINSIILGIFDAFFPNVKNSIKKIESEYISDNDMIQINYLRLLVCLLTFSFLVLNFFKVIEIDDLIKFINAINKK